MEKYTLWSYDPANQTYIGTRPIQTIEKLPPGYYRLSSGQFGEPKVKILGERQDKVCQFKFGPFDTVLDEVNKFWGSTKRYEELGVTHKRGILLYGPPGCGKSGIISGVIKNVISHDGIALSVQDYYDLDYFSEQLPLFRQIQGNSPVVVVLEDIEHYAEGSEEELLEVLDGSSSVGGGILYLATTNKLNKIPPRIRCRPSRIDTLIEIPYPSASQREEYARFLLSSTSGSTGDLVSDIINTTEISLADVKEIIISCYVYGKTYTETINRIREAKIIENKDNSQ